MDVGELLDYDPILIPKKVAVETVEKKKGAVNKTTSGKRKRSRNVETSVDGGNVPGIAGAESAQSERERKVMKLVDEAETVDVLDESGLKKMVLSFEKKVLKNQELRIKFPDMPEKFMESEVELNTILDEMHIMATVPELYSIVIELNCVHSLIGLLTHDNTDISCAVVDLLQELTDTDTMHENEDDVLALIDVMLDNQVVGLLVENVERLDEQVKEESVGVHNTMAIIENISDLKNEVCDDMAKQGLLVWLLKRLKAKIPFDSNKLYASEILAILLQNSDENRELLGQHEGIDILLQQLAYFKRHEPSSKEEAELMENLFDCICSCLIWNDNKPRFLVGEGLELMNLMLREKKTSRHSAVKVLNYALSGDAAVNSCNKFVEIFGLRAVFPIFMKTPKSVRKLSSQEQHEEHVSSIIASLLRNCNATNKARILSKFTESDHAKVDRLMELHFKYLQKVQVVDNRIDRERVKLKLGGEDVDDDMEEDFYLRRLEGGLFTLQLVDYIIMEICNTGAASVKQRVTQLLSLRGASTKTLKNIIREYAGNLGDRHGQGSRNMEQQYLLSLVDKF